MKVKYKNFGIMKAVFMTLDKMAVADISTEITKENTRIEVYEASHSAMISAEIKSESGGIYKFAFLQEYIKDILQFLDNDTYINIEDTDVSFMGKNNYKMGIGEFTNEDGKGFGEFVKKVNKELTSITVSSKGFKQNYNALRKLGSRVTFNLVAKDGKGELKLSGGGDSGEVGGNNTLDVPAIMDDIDITSSYHHDLLDSMLPILGLCDNLKIGFGNDQPLIINPIIEDNNIYILVAPNVKQEE